MIALLLTLKVLVISTFRRLVMSVIIRLVILTGQPSSTLPFFTVRVQLLCLTVLTAVMMILFIRRG